MRNFDIITTATYRPEIFKRTFKSFIDNLFRGYIKRANLIINIDPVGCPANLRSRYLREILEFISEQGFNEITVNCPDEASFSKAFHWLLGKIESTLVFNLEEDWELVRPIDFEEMLEEFKEDPCLAHLRLSAFDSGDYQLKQWNKFIPWTGSFFEVPRDLRGTIGWCGHPSLNSGTFLRYFHKRLDPERNPEKQIKGNHPIIHNSFFGVWQEQKQKAAIKDIGRRWMKENGYQKQGTDAFFTQWEKVEEN